MWIRSGCGLNLNIIINPPLAPASLWHSIPHCYVFVFISIYLFIHFNAWNKTVLSIYTFCLRFTSCLSLVVWSCLVSPVLSNTSWFLFLHKPLCVLCSLWKKKAFSFRCGFSIAGLVSVYGFVVFIKLPTGSCILAASVYDVTNEPHWNPLSGASQWGCKLWR